MDNANKAQHTQALDITNGGAIYKYPIKARADLTIYLQAVYADLRKREDRRGSSGRKRISNIRTDLRAAAEQYCSEHFKPATDEYLETEDSPTIEWEREYPNGRSAFFTGPTGVQDGYARRPTDLRTRQQRLTDGPTWQPDTEYIWDDEAGWPKPK